MRAPSSPAVLLIVERSGLAYVHSGQSFASTGLGTAVADTPQQEDLQEEYVDFRLDSWCMALVR